MIQVHLAVIYSIHLLFPRLHIIFSLFPEPKNVCTDKIITICTCTVCHILGKSQEAPLWENSSYTSTKTNRISVYKIHTLKIPSCCIYLQIVFHLCGIIFSNSCNVIDYRRLIKERKMLDIPN